MKKLRTCECGTYPISILYLGREGNTSTHTIRCPNCFIETAPHFNCYDAMIEWGFEEEEIITTNK